MSAALFRDFFPSTTRFIQSQSLLAKAWDLVFPGSVEKICPRPEISITVFDGQSFVLRWPYASVSCFLGIIMGICYGTILLNRSVKKYADRGSFTWGFAFLWYGLMSVGGLFYHCLLPNKLFYLIDVISTACASISIIAGFWVFTTIDDTASHWRISMAGAYLLTAALAIQGTQIVKEVIYLAPAASAFVCGIWFCLKNVKGQSRAAMAWLAVAAAASLAALAAVPGDRWMCEVVGAEFNLLMWFFTGCDMALWALFRFVREAREEQKMKAS